jgi:hypothetical protein
MNVLSSEPNSNSFKKSYLLLSSAIFIRFVKILEGNRMQDLNLQIHKLEMSSPVEQWKVRCYFRYFHNYLQGKEWAMGENGQFFDRNICHPVITLQ